MSRVRSVVTDHAVLRYLERVCGVDIRAIREEIQAATAEGREVAALMGFGGVKVISGRAKFVVVGGRVVSTCLRTRRRAPRRDREALD